MREQAKSNGKSHQRQHHSDTKKRHCARTALAGGAASPIILGFASARWRQARSCGSLQKFHFKKNNKKKKQTRFGMTALKRVFLRFPLI
ncbi:hypothetical protein [Allofranklinella schreckenbergeri]|uniref:hypothetical protein n=1 Tax=Allofranklinella schreckenbergeri TaxID=1076744 RepID=UPI0011C44902|nr:hypothetical protein [Allofranklinella schreckenbergeri]